MTLPAHEANMYEAPTVPRLSAKKWGTQAAWGGSGALGARRRGESDVTMAPLPPPPSNVVSTVTETGTSWRGRFGGQALPSAGEGDGRLLSR